MIFDIFQKMVQLVISKELSDVDHYLRKNRRSGELVNTGKRKKTFLTRFGDVSISRTRYLEKTGKARYLLAEAISTFKNQRVYFWVTPAAMNRSVIASLLRPS